MRSYRGSCEHQEYGLSPTWHAGSSSGNCIKQCRPIVE